jgi:hypothetical protein
VTYGDRFHDVNSRCLQYSRRFKDRGRGRVRSSQCALTIAGRCNGGDVRIEHSACRDKCRSDGRVRVENRA